MKIGSYKKTITISISIIISLVIAEIFLRIFVIKPWENVSVEDPLIFETDPILGWKAKEGTYNFSPTHITGKKFNMSFKKNGERENGNASINAKSEILIIGGSFAQGWGVNDNETFSYKLQKKYVNYKIYNFGQGGYGSVQSFLLLEGQISKIKSPKLVIYGLIQHHEYRNVAHASWLRMLSRYSSRGHVYTPYGNIGADNQLLLNTPIGYSSLPFREVSSVITLIEKIYMKLKSRKRIYIKLKSKKRKKQQTIVTKKTILKMKEISEKFGSNFILVNLDWAGSFKKENYENFFRKNEIKFVNCAVPLNKKFTIPGDYHPNEKAHTHYKDCLVDYIDKQKLLIF